MADLITGEYGVCAGDSILYHRPHQRYEFVHSITPDGLITELLSTKRTQSHSSVGTTSKMQSFFLGIRNSSRFPMKSSLPPTN